MSPFLARVTKLTTLGPVGEAPGDLGRFGLDPPLWVISLIDPGDGKRPPIHLLLGRKDADFYTCLQAGGPIHRIEPALFSELESLLR